MKSPGEIDSMRRAGALLWSILQNARESVQPGQTTAELDALIREAMARSNAKPVMLGYRGQRGDTAPFGGAASISINEEIVHAPPGPRILRRGDVATIDCALRLDGWCADAAVSMVVGEDKASGSSRMKLIGAARAVLSACLAAAAPGQRWSEVAAAAWAEARRHGMTLLTDFAGHGIGRGLHEGPTVAFDVAEHPAAAARLDFVLRPGMAFTIEPVLVPGQTGVLGLDDGWTVVTADRSSAAHEERTVAVGRREVSVLTG